MSDKAKDGIVLAFVPPAERPAAEALDKRLRSQARAVVHSMERFKELIREAMRSQIHVALGFRSWPDYIAAVVSQEMGTLSIEDRRTVVAVLGGEGMSNPAIGAALGVDQSTIYRDKQALQNANPAPTPTTVTGRDGKVYHNPRPKPDVPKPPPQPVDAEVVEDETLDDVIRRISQRGDGQGKVTQEEIVDLLKHDEVFHRLRSFHRRLRQAGEEACALKDAVNDALDEARDSDDPTFWFRGYWDLPEELAAAELRLAEVQAATGVIRALTSVATAAKTTGTAPVEEGEP